MACVNASPSVIATSSIVWCSSMCRSPFASIFRSIDPCGYPGLEVTQMRDLGIGVAVKELTEQLIGHLETRLTVQGSPR